MLSWWVVNRQWEVYESRAWSTSSGFHSQKAAWSGCMGTCDWYLQPTHLDVAEIPSFTGRGGLWEQQRKACWIHRMHVGGFQKMRSGVGRWSLLCGGSAGTHSFSVCPQVSPCLTGWLVWKLCVTEGRWAGTHGCLREVGEWSLLWRSQVTVTWGLEPKWNPLSTTGAPGTWLS